MHVAFAFEHFNQRLQLQVATGRYQVLFTMGYGSSILVPGLLVVARSREGITNHFLHPHACVWITSLDTRLVRRARALWIFSQSKLDPWHRAGKKKFLYRPSVLNLHNGIQSADRICGTV